VRPFRWRCAAPPAVLAERHVELVGPANERSLSGALATRPSSFVADLDEATDPSWWNALDAQRQLRATIGLSIRAERPAVPILFRPRALDHTEENVFIDGAPVPSALFDIGLYCFHNARLLAAWNEGPFFSFTKLHGAVEAALWNDVLAYMERELAIPSNTFKASVRIDTVQAANEMDDILWYLRDRSLGLACGREEYIRDLITTRGATEDSDVTPDRTQITVDRAPLAITAQRLIETCRERGVHAMGPLAREVPFHADRDAARSAYTRICAGTTRHAQAGFDGTRVVHSSLVAVARAAFTIAARSPSRVRIDRYMRAGDLMSLHSAAPSEGSVRENIRVALVHLEASLGGRARVARSIFIEDGATARAARAQLWEWVQGAIPLDGRSVLDRERFRAICREEALRLGAPAHIHALLQHVCLARTQVAFEAAEGVLARAPVDRTG